MQQQQQQQLKQQQCMQQQCMQQQQHLRRQQPGSALTDISKGHIYGQKTAPALTAINTGHRKGQKFAPDATATSTEHACGHRFASHMHRAFKSSTNLIPRRVRSSAATTGGNSRGIMSYSSLQEEHALEQRATTYMAQRCGSKGHDEDQGWGKGTLAQDKDRVQGASLSSLDHLQGSVLAMLRFAFTLSNTCKGQYYLRFAPTRQAALPRNRGPQVCLPSQSTWICEMAISRCKMDYLPLTFAWTSQGACVKIRWLERGMTEATDVE